MKKDKLIDLLRLGEDEQMEFKTVCRTSVVGRQVCAFLNGDGGYVVCGVGDKGTITGIVDPERLPKLENELAKGLRPSALVSVETHQIEGKQILVIEVPKGKDMPYAFQDQIYVRTGAQTHKADIETVKDMVLRRQVEPERWERRFSSADIETDINTDEVAAIVKAVEHNSRMQFHHKDDMRAVLQDVAMAKYGRLTNGGDVFFAREPELRHPQARVRAVCFTTDKADDTYRDEKSFGGPLVSVLEEVYRFIVRNTPSLAHFKKGELERNNEPLYPADAVREGLVNAFAHRDYADYKGGVSVHIYPRRLEIWNSGGLPHGVEVEDLAKGHLSVLRNPDIAHVLYLRGMMEKVGRGCFLIQNLCKTQELPAPEWRAPPDQGVTLTFHAPATLQEWLGEGTKSGLSRDQVTNAHPGSTPEVPRKHPGSTPEVRLLAAVSGEQSRQDLQKAMGLKDDEHFRRSYLLPALEKKLIEKTIPQSPRSPKQKYRLTDKGRELLREAGT